MEQHKPLILTTMMKFMPLILSDLEEESYEFSVTTQDPDGNLSIPQFVAGFAIGDEFISDQDPREIIGYSFDS